MVRRAPLWPCLREAVAFVPKAWAGAWGALLMLAFVSAAPILSGQRTVSLEQTIDYGSLTALVAVWPFVFIAASTIASGALYRLGVFGRDARSEGLGIGGLQFGKPELRLLGGGALVVLFLVIVAVGLFVAVAILTTAASGEDVSPSAASAVQAINVAALLILAVLYVRLSLYAPAVVGRRRVVSLDSLALAQGAFWTLLIGIVACLLPTALVAGGLGLAPVPDTPLAAFVTLNGVAALIVFVQAPLLTGFLSAAYKHLEYVDRSN